jgi:hypothetical protein
MSENKDTTFNQQDEVDDLIPEELADPEIFDQDGILNDLYLDFDPENPDKSIENKTAVEAQPMDNGMRERLVSEALSDTFKEKIAEMFNNYALEPNEKKGLAGILIKFKKYWQKSWITRLGIGVTLFFNKGAIFNPTLAAPVMAWRIASATMGAEALLYRKQVGQLFEKSKNQRSKNNIQLFKEAGVNFLSTIVNAKKEDLGDKGFLGLGRLKKANEEYFKTFSSDTRIRSEQDLNEHINAMNNDEKISWLEKTILTIAQTARMQGVKLNELGGENIIEENERTINILINKYTELIADRDIQKVTDEIESIIKSDPSTGETTIKQTAINQYLESIKPTLDSLQNKVIKEIDRKDKIRWATSFLWGTISAFTPFALHKGHESWDLNHQAKPNIPMAQAATSSHNFHGETAQQNVNNIMEKANAALHEPEKTTHLTVNDTQNRIIENNTTGSVINDSAKNAFNDSANTAQQAAEANAKIDTEYGAPQDSSSQINHPAPSPAETPTTKPTITPQGQHVVRPDHDAKSTGGRINEAIHPNSDVNIEKLPESVYGENLGISNIKDGHGQVNIYNEQFHAFKKYDGEWYIKVPADVNHNGLPEDGQQIDINLKDGKGILTDPTTGARTTFYAENYRHLLDEKGNLSDAQKAELLNGHADKLLARSGSIVGLDKNGVAVQVFLEKGHIKVSGDINPEGLTIKGQPIDPKVTYSEGQLKDVIFDHFVAHDGLTNPAEKAHDIATQYEWAKQHLPADGKITAELNSHVKADIDALTREIQHRMDLPVTDSHHFDLTHSTYQNLDNLHKETIDGIKPQGHAPAPPQANQPEAPAPKPTEHENNENLPEVPSHVIHSSTEIHYPEGISVESIDETTKNTINHIVEKRDYLQIVDKNEMRRIVHESIEKNDIIGTIRTQLTAQNELTDSATHSAFENLKKMLNSEKFVFLKDKDSYLVIDPTKHLELKNLNKDGIFQIVTAKK